MKTHAVQLSICYNVLGHMQDSLSILGLAGEFCLIQPAISYSLVLFFTSTKANFVFFFNNTFFSPHQQSVLQGTVFFLSLHAFNQMYAKPHAGIFLGTIQLAYRREKLGRSPSPARGVRGHAPPGNF